MCSDHKMEGMIEQVLENIEKKGRKVAKKEEQKKGEKVQRKVAKKQGVSKKKRGKNQQKVIFVKTVLALVENIRHRILVFNLF